MKTVFSGIQPTGNLHLGRYFGAVKNWVKLQGEYNCYFCVVDYHAITMPYDPEKLKENTWNLALDLIACGVDPNKIFIQSHIPEHTELAWLLSSRCSFGSLNKMTQFKSKSEGNFTSVGLFTYPILQAADILLYKTDLVPVGKDQKQHIELCRDIAVNFNSFFGKQVFNIPEPIFTEFPKIMSTADPNKKMSASLGPKHNISLFSPIDVIAKQIKAAVTDTGGEEMYGLGVGNLLTILEASESPYTYPLKFEMINKEKVSYKALKEAVTDSLIELVTPLQEKRKEWGQQIPEMKALIVGNGERFREVAKSTMKEVKQLIGL